MADNTTTQPCSTTGSKKKSKAGESVDAPAPVVPSKRKISDIDDTVDEIIGSGNVRTIKAAINDIPPTNVSAIRRARNALRPCMDSL